MPAIWISEEPKRNLQKSSLIEISAYKLRYVPIGLITLYQKFFSPFWPPSCRFYPTCSSYAHHAFKKYGIVKGGALALIRICKCNPLHPGGYDPLV
ncbi:MAG: membrane protein insertion efficiency factor YidD [Desulfobacteraceae bacterium]|nr:membrane protein insertion efficiency factor YidD [Desulfobacteraceae bacterium]